MGTWAAYREDILDEQASSACSRVLHKLQRSWPAVTKLTCLLHYLLVIHVAFDCRFTRPYFWQGVSGNFMSLNILQDGKVKTVLSRGRALLRRGTDSNRACKKRWDAACFIGIESLMPQNKPIPFRAARFRSRLLRFIDYCFVWDRLQIRSGPSSWRLRLTLAVGYRQGKAPPLMSAQPILYSSDRCPSCESCGPPQSFGVKSQITCDHRVQCWFTTRRRLLWCGGAAAVDQTRSPQLSKKSVGRSAVPIG